MQSRLHRINFNLHMHVIISCTHSYPHRELERQARSNRKMSKKERRKKMEGSSDEESGGDLESVGGELSGSGVWCVGCACMLMCLCVCICMCVSDRVTVVHVSE